MLFNLCNCAAPLVSSGDPLCIGGAGFVTAVMPTHAAKGRTREAKRLRENVPEVDRLAVRIVTDNLTQLFVPEEARDGLTIERRVPFSYPDRSPRYILNAEWGLSLHAQSFADGEERNVLVDCRGWHAPPSLTPASGLSASPKCSWRSG